MWIHFIPVTHLKRFRIILRRFGDFTGTIWSMNTLTVRLFPRRWYYSVTCTGLQNYFLRTVQEGRNAVIISVSYKMKILSHFILVKKWTWLLGEVITTDDQKKLTAFEKIGLDEYLTHRLICEREMIDVKMSCAGERYNGRPWDGCITK